MKTNNPALGNDTGLPEDMSPDATRARIAAVCAEFDLPIPKLTVRRGKVYLTDELTGWFKLSGLTMDWVLCGGVMPLVRAYRKQWLQDQELRATLRNFDDEETKMLLELLKTYSETVKARRAQMAEV